VSFGHRRRDVFPQLEALFFENPWVYRAPPGQYGILFLLRRDINNCLGAEAGMQNRTDRQIQWPGAMCIFAGIDLLAKFRAGEDGPKKVGSRFKAFVERFFHLPASEAETLYQLRNSMLHSFGLYSRGKDGAVYRFTLVSCGARPLVRHTPPDQYLVDVISLHEDFEKAVGEYRQALQGDSALQQNFMAMFPNYGAIYISGGGC
jgi:hypothetical protein